MQVSTKLQVASFLLKELRNYNRQLFLYLPQKLAKTQPAFWTDIFHDFTVWLIKLSTYMQKNEFTSYKQCIFGLLFFEKPKKVLFTRHVPAFLKELICQKFKFFLLFSEQFDVNTNVPKWASLCHEAFIYL